MKNDFQVAVTTTSIADILGSLQSDYSDVRFTDENGRELYFWADPSTSSLRQFWVRVSTLNANPSYTTIYLYYGNTDTALDSNIKDTFVVGDDFNDNSLSTVIWSTSTLSTGNWDEGSTRIEH